MPAGAFEQAKKVKCPKCGSEPDEDCVSVKDKYPLSTLHNERLRAAGFGSAKKNK